MKKLAIFIGLLLGTTLIAQAATVLFVNQGGTGASTFTTSNLLYGAGTASIKSVATTSVTCAGTASCTSFTVIGPSPITITGAAAGAFPFTPTTNYGALTNATGTPIWFQAGLQASTTSHFVTADFSGGATTTNLLSTGSTTISGAFNSIVANWFASSTLNGNTLFSFATGTSLTITGSSTIGKLNLGIPLAVSSGGTGAATLTGCLTGNGTGAITGSGTCNTSSATVSSIIFGTGLNGGTITTTGNVSLLSYIATSTAEVAGQLAAWGSSSSVPAKLYSVATSSISLSAGLTNTGTLGNQVGGSSLTLKQVENRSFSYSTTTWTGTTTIPLESGYGELWNYAQCFTIPNGATVDVDFIFHSNGTTHVLPFIIASSTAGKTAFTSNNTITASASTTVDIGTPAGTPTSLNCSVNDVI